MTHEPKPTEGGETASRAAEEMAKYGIDYAPVPCYHYKEFRYAKLEDALSQAKRDISTTPLDRRISEHFSTDDAVMSRAGKAPRRKDSPWCDTKGTSIVEGGYTR